MQPALAVPARVDVGSEAQLRQRGSLLVKDSALGPILVIAQRGTGQLRAVDPRCPHKGAIVAWLPQENRFSCPRHQASFAADGSLIQSDKTRRSLQSFRVSVVKGRVLVSAA